MSAKGDGAKLLRERAGGPLEFAIVLGTGLSAIADRLFPGERIPYVSIAGMPHAELTGHSGEAHVGVWHGRRCVAFAGRVHLYQGFSALDVCASVELASAAGAKTIVLTNAAGGLTPDLPAGSLMLINDHLNLTGTNPLIGRRDDDPFVDMLDAYDPELLAIATASAQRLGIRLRRGVYAALAGPSYETAAEARYLRAIGADAVGMSTVLETIFARRRAMRVLALSIITNVVGVATNHSAVTQGAQSAAASLATLLDAVVEALP